MASLAAVLALGVTSAGPASAQETHSEHRSRDFPGGDGIGLQADYSARLNWVLTRRHHPMT